MTAQHEAPHTPGGEVVVEIEADGLADFAITVTPAEESSVQVGWRPIETAPRDGTWFVALQNGETYPCEWHATEPDEGPTHEGWWDHFNDSFEEPTHWQPAPAAPAEARSEQPVGRPVPPHGSGP